MTVLDDAPFPDLADPESPRVDVCALADLPLDRGVAALVGGAAVAIFRWGRLDELFAIGNVDPYSGASVLSRGLVGSVDGRAFVASPVFKQRFDLATGRAIDDPDVGVEVHRVEVVRGRVLVAVAAGPA
jgi:nitrite reductase (NADH) small subunit